MAQYEAADGKRETVKLTDNQIESLISGEHVEIQTACEGSVTLYQTGTRMPTERGANSPRSNWEALLSGEKDEITWYHMPLRVVRRNTGAVLRFDARIVNDFRIPADAPHEITALDEGGMFDFIVGTTADAVISGNPQTWRDDNLDGDWEVWRKFDTMSVERQE